MYEYLYKLFIHSGVVFIGPIKCISMVIIEIFGGNVKGSDRAENNQLIDEGVVNLEGGFK